MEDLRDKGYIIGRSSNQCVNNLAQIHKGDISNFYDQVADHEGLVFSCDPNYQEPRSMFGVFSGPNSVLRRCINGIDSHQYMLDYG
jgi:hypothetical protein